MVFLRYFFHNNEHIHTITRYIFYLLDELFGIGIEHLLQLQVKLYQGNIKTTFFDPIESVLVPVNVLTRVITHTSDICQFKYGFQLNSPSRAEIRIRDHPLQTSRMQHALDCSATIALISFLTQCVTQCDQTSTYELNKLLPHLGKFEFCQRRTFGVKFL